MTPDVCIHDTGRLHSSHPPAARAAGAQTASVGGLPLHFSLARSSPTFARREEKSTAMKSALRPSGGADDGGDELKDVQLFMKARHTTAKVDLEVVCSSAHRGTTVDRRHRVLSLHGSKLSADTRQLLDWPESTDKCCWHCTERFETVPMCMVDSVDEMTGLHRVYGVFCGARCAVGYVRERHSYDNDRRIMLFQKIAHEVFGVEMKEVEAAVSDYAPPQCMLEKFGGPLTLEEMRAGTGCATMRVLQPPFVSLPIVLEEEARKGQLHGATTGAADFGAIGMTANGSHSVRGLCRPAVIPKKASFLEAPAVGGMYDDFLKNPPSEEEIAAQNRQTAPKKEAPSRRKAAATAAAAPPPVRGGAGDAAPSSKPAAPRARGRRRAVAPMVVSQGPLMRFMKNKPSKAAPAQQQ